MEENNDYIIAQIIKGFLGEPKSEHDALSKKQWQFNCPSPKCRHDIDKFNLEYNSEKHLFKCWKCEYKGFVYQLAQDYGAPVDLQRVQSILPPDKVDSLRSKIVDKPKVDHHLVTCKLPEGYFPLGKNRNTPLYKLAWDFNWRRDRDSNPGYLAARQFSRLFHSTTLASLQIRKYLWLPRLDSNQ